ncbi:hypothetical protein PR048_008223 [Dryococelus australis]|uniref:Uncharacterized protein n=1 Tax=Dryococelus australis TaxID=614101 RepID=A0ABQ9HWH9_9NEOP|nr:hypothetical protein PR048_008223 [Dryococelus australis]
MTPWVVAAALGNEWLKIASRYVRDASGSYNGCIILINMLTLITMIMWLTEIVYKRCKTKDTPSED